MNKPNNQKRKNSIEKIEKTFLNLIQKKNIDEISVSEICKICQLNRSTFYSNYVDIYDLVNKVKLKMKKDFGDFQISKNSKLDKDGFLTMFQYIKDNQIFFKTYFKLESISPEYQIPYHTDLAKKYYDNKHIDYHIEFFKAGLNAVINKWLNGGCKESPEEISEIIASEYNIKNLEN